jgi:hypothetical protein
LAVALAKLDPAPHGFDWNALMFAAGRASKTRALIFWRVVAGVCALTACGFAFAYFTRPEVVVERERAVTAERPPAKAVEPLPPAAVLPAVPAPLAVPEPTVKPSVPESPVPTEPQSWAFEAPPEPGAAVRWFSLRNDVLTVGLGVLPDTGRKVSAPRQEKIVQTTP